MLPVEFPLAALYENRRADPWSPLLRPSAVAALPDGRFFLADYGSGRVHRFDAAGFYADEIDDGGGSLLPLDLAGHGLLLYVLDNNSRRILRFTDGGVFRDVLLDVDRLERRGRIEPAAMDIDRDGRVAIADAANHQVLVTGPFLELETTVGEYGSFQSQFQEPRGVCFGVEGVLYVSDRGNRRVQAFDRTGFLLAASGSVDDTDPPFVAPSGMDTDRHGNVYVCDTGGARVVVLTPALEVVTTLGDGGIGDSRLERPVDCAIGPDGRLFVVDVGRNALLVYEILYP